MLKSNSDKNTRLPSKTPLINAFASLFSCVFTCQVNSPNKTLWTINLFIFSSKRTFFDNIQFISSRCIWDGKQFFRRFEFNSNIFRFHSLLHSFYSFTPTIFTPQTYSHHYFRMYSQPTFKSVQLPHAASNGEGTTQLMNLRSKNLFEIYNAAEICRSFLHYHQ